MTYLMTAFVEASASEEFTSKISVPVGASSGTVAEYMLKANVGTLSLTSSTVTAMVPVPVRAGEPAGKVGYKMLEVTNTTMLIRGLPSLI